MLVDIGLAPIFLILIVFVAFSILVDVLVELYSIRLTLCSGRIQRWCYNRFGHSLLGDSLLSAGIQLLSFRHRSFFLQIVSFFNVGSFSRRQIFYILYGTFIGIGLTSALLIYPHIYLAILLMGFGFVLNRQALDQWKDLGAGALCLGLVFLALFLFHHALLEMAVNIHQYHFSEFSFIISIVATALFFRTPLPFLILLATSISLMEIKPLSLPVILFLHGFSALLPFYQQFFSKQKRIHFSLFIVLAWQLLQLGISTIAIYLAQDLVGSWLTADSFLYAFQKSVVIYLGYHCSLIVIAPLVFLLKGFSFLNEKDGARPAQQILSPQKQGRVFSLHFSLFLLRQEFVKMATMVHTVFKIGREADEDELEVSQKLSKYRGIIERVGVELKELCFSVGKQRAYRWHIQEILSYYKNINQLELMVEDLSAVMDYLQKESVSEDIEKQCRYWLSLQLKVYEIFFNRVCEVEDPVDEKSENLVKKSYEVLDRLFNEFSDESELSQLSKVFYRVTESNGALGLVSRKI